VESNVEKNDGCCHDKAKCPQRRGRRGLLEPALLVTLAAQESHGYELPSAVEELTGACPDSAAVYRMLRSLEEAGAVESSWVEADSGPARRDYRVTEHGRALLGEWAQELADRSRVCASLAEMATGQAEPQLESPSAAKGTA
jgi:PadR family transcriptional regulator, regulatory protein PadR